MFTSIIYKRLSAYIIDNVIIFLATLILIPISAIFGIASIYHYAFIGWIIITIFIAYFDSSHFQGTPGKMLMQIKIVSTEGTRIDFLTAIYRCIILSLPIISFCCAIMILFRKDHRTGYDILTKSVIIFR
ncbi:MAG: putative RDD family membrane protein YckC [Candidatus Midichloriaceae bacterium]|jgi:uncharacterized RDD family membrane protein YckC